MWWHTALWSRVRDYICQAAIVSTLSAQRSVLLPLPRNYGAWTHTSSFTVVVMKEWSKLENSVKVSSSDKINRSAASSECPCHWMSHFTSNPVSKDILTKKASERRFYKQFKRGRGIPAHLTSGWLKRVFYVNHKRASMTTQSVRSSSDVSTYYWVVECLGLISNPLCLHFYFFYLCVILKLNESIRISRRQEFFSHGLFDHIKKLYWNWIGCYYCEFYQSSFLSLFLLLYHHPFLWVCFIVLFYYSDMAIYHNKSGSWGCKRHMRCFWGLFKHFLCRLDSAMSP